MRKVLISSLLAGGALWVAAPALAHPHEAEPAHHGEGQVVANGQNHPGFTQQADGTWISCEGVKEPANAGPAGYGLETAHHGPDEGQPGKADGCFVEANHPATPEADRNPALG